MKAKNLNFVWAIVLIAAGGIALAQNFGFLQDISWPWWTLLFGGLSLLFFASYFISGISQWGWLVPALIFAALAVELPLRVSGFNNPLIGAPSSPPSHCRFSSPTCLIGAVIGGPSSRRACWPASAQW